MFLRVSKYPSTAIFRNANNNYNYYINARKINVNWKGITDSLQRAVAHGHLRIHCTVDNVHGYNEKN